MPSPTVLMTGLAFGESPRWHDGRLWLSNWGTPEIVAVDMSGASEVVVRLPFLTIPFSLAWLPDGRLLVASGAATPLMRQEPDGSLVPYATLDRGLNEIVVDGRGNTYVNRPGFDMMAGAEFAPGEVILVTPDGAARPVADGIAFPNGMAITQDNATLIVADSYGKQLTALAIAPDGGLGPARLWADLGDGVPDGISLDAEGAVWYADVPNKRCVRVREGGEVLETVEVDRGCFACMLGGADGRTLFILAAEWNGPAKMFGAARTGQVLTVAVSAPAAGWP